MKKKPVVKIEKLRKPTFNVNIICQRCGSIAAFGPTSKAEVSDEYIEGLVLGNLKACNLCDRLICVDCLLPNTEMMNVCRSCQSTYRCYIRDKHSLDDEYSKKKLDLFTNYKQMALTKLGLD